ncbi:hypothetical protein MKX03_005769 [Papaver bracteatum]|nr:hypothetical protein MKX03_005769 [Papaver bracteatum]
MNLRKCKKHLHAKYVVHPNASNTLFVEWFPTLSSCLFLFIENFFSSGRFFSYIIFSCWTFTWVCRYLALFVGFKEVRLMRKESRHCGNSCNYRGDPLVLYFVDFINPVQAATALSALQGEHKRLTLLLSSHYVKLIYIFMHKFILPCLLVIFT